VFCTCHRRISVNKQGIEGSCGPFPIQFSAVREWRWSGCPLGTSIRSSPRPHQARHTQGTRSSSNVLLAPRRRNRRRNADSCRGMPHCHCLAGLGRGRLAAAQAQAATSRAEVLLGHVSRILWPAMMRARALSLSLSEAIGVRHWLAMMRARALSLSQQRARSLFVTINPKPQNLNPKPEILNPNP